MGRHPFAGRYSGRGDMPIETAIQQFRFAYGTQRHQTQMQPPPRVPSLGVMSEGVASLFERAFSAKAANGAQRPAAQEWIGGLEALGNSLRQCKVTQSHAYFSGLSGCPWCEIENETGTALFNIVVLPTTDPYL